VSTRRVPGLPRHCSALLGAVSVGLVALASLVALDTLFPPPLSRLAEVSVVITDRDDRPLRAFPVDDGRWRMGAELTQIDPAFLEALVVIEDRRFFCHRGVDVRAVLRATRDALRAGRVVSGGSTITMQTARLLEPRPQRTLIAKGIEMLRALQLERRYDKDDILAMYLTLTPYGGNLEGLRAASWAWLGREPTRLTPAETALLIALPQAPEARRPDRHPIAAAQARARILARMTTAGLLSETRAAEAAMEPIPERQAFPAVAWHASERARAEQAEPRVRATLEFGLQLELERMVRDAALTAGREVQIAALVVEIDGRAVRAAAGSAGRDRAGGWLDLSARPRSPGSVLKPLIYALAFEDGLVTAATRIEDAPRSFGGYAPANFDRGYRGEVTVAEALQQSLNVPAVQLLAATGAPRYAATLAMAGATLTLPAGGNDTASLALALGGFGISAADVASLYAALGDGGRMRPLAWTEQAAHANRTGPAQKMVADHAARRVLAVLGDAPPPDGRLPARLLAGAPQPAFKTGTSWGFRDAWAAGVVGEHVIVVWVGRADGAPRPGVTGQRAALPLLFDLADVLARRHATGIMTATQPEFDAVSVRDALRRFGKRDPAPEIIFPPDGAEVWAEDQQRSFVPAARGRAPLRWYSNGAPVPLDAAGAPVWTPGTPGFHELVVIDREGRSASTRVRVRAFKASAAGGAGEG